MTANHRGISFDTDRRQPADEPELARNLAIIIGINDYANGIPRLETAVNDAEQLADLLRKHHRYATLLLTQTVTRERLLAELHKAAGIATEQDRVLFYFAGHGIALDGDEGPEGYLIPQDADAKDPASFLPMTELSAALDALPCRHLLAILDCCFAGSFRWAGISRAIPHPPTLIHRERYLRYIRHPARQVITSAAHDQKALDVLGGDIVGRHGQVGYAERLHSPFARALIEGLSGAADQLPDGGDGLVTATELYLYLREAVEPTAKQHASHDQTPGLWPLRGHDKGEYVFRTPGKTFDPPPAPALTEANNPYRGLQAFERKHGALFFGRTRLVDRLKTLVAEQPIVAVLGVSGSGKSSLVNAGLLPRLQPPIAAASAVPDDDATVLVKRVVDRQGRRLRSWHCLEPLRPGSAPDVSLVRHLFRHLPATGARAADPGSDTAIVSLINARPEADGLVKSWLDAHPGQRLLLVLDQFEEIITQCRDDEARDRFLGLLDRLLILGADRLSLVLTVRLDFEPMILDRWRALRQPDATLAAGWGEAQRFIVTPMTNDELRAAIEQPAAERVLFFDPPSLVQRLVDEVQQAAAPLPLLSFTLSELYARRDPDNRVLSTAVYDELGGVVGALRNRANEEFDRLDAAHQATMRRIMLRMIAFEGGELARRRVPKSELDYADDEENQRVEKVLHRLDQARLIVGGSAENAWGEEESYREPVHDSLILAWDRIRTWYADTAQALGLLRRITRASKDWQTSAKSEKHKRLWHDEPRLDEAVILASLPEPLAVRKLGSEAQEERPSATQRLRRRLVPNLQLAPAEPLLDALETRFIHASLKRRRDRLRRSIAIASVITLVILGASGFAVVQREAAERERLEAIRQLAVTQWNNAMEKREDDPLLSAHYFAGASEKFSETQEYHAAANADLARKYYYRWPKLKVAVIGDVIQPHRCLEPQLSADGERILTSRHGRPRLWNSQSGEELELGVPFKQQEIPFCAQFSDDGTQILTWCREDWCDQATVQTWDSVIGDPLPPDIKPEAAVRYAKLADDGIHMLTRVGRERWQIWDTRSGKEFIPYHDGEAMVRGVDSKGNRILTFTTEDARLWNSRTGERIGQPLKHGGSFSGARLSPDGSRILTWGGSARLWDASTGDELTPPLAPRSWISGAEFSPDGARVLTYGGSSYRLWDSANENVLVRAFKIGVTDVSFSPDGDHILTWGPDGAQLWDGRKGNELPLDNRNAFYPEKAEFNADGTRILAWGTDGAALWDRSTGQAIPLPVEGNLGGAQFSPDGNCILSWTADGASAQLWDSVSGNALTPPTRHAFLHATFSTDGSSILTWGKEIGNATEVLFTGKEGGIRLWHRGRDRLSTLLLEPGDAISDAQFSVDGARVLAWVTGGSARLWDSRTGKPLARPFGKGLEGAIFNPDGDRVLTWGPVGAQLWDRDGVNVLGASLGQDGGVSQAEFSADGSRILTWNEQGARLWDSSNGTPVGPRIGHEGGVSGAEFSPDGARFLTWSMYRKAWLWNGVEPVPLSHEHTMGARFSPDGARILTWGGHHAELWDGTSGKSVGQPIPHTCDHAPFSPDGSRLLACSGNSDQPWRLWQSDGRAALNSPLRHLGSDDETVMVTDDGARILAWGDQGVRLWESSSGKAIDGQIKHVGAVSGATFFLDGTYILTWNTDGARLWDRDGAKASELLRAPIDELLSAELNADGSRILTWSQGENGGGRLWDTGTGDPIGQPIQQAGWFSGIRFSPDGTRLLTWNADGSLQLWDRNGEKTVESPFVQEGGISQVEFSADGSRILTRSAHAQGAYAARLWDSSSGKAVGQPIMHQGGVTATHLSPDGTRFVSIGADGSARLWNARTGLALPHDLGDGTQGALFSPDGARVLTWSDDRGARLWDVETGDALTPALDHEGTVSGAKVGANGERVLTWRSNKVWVWDGSTGAQLIPPLHHDGSIDGVGVSTDGSRIVTWGAGHVRVWDSRSGEPLPLAMDLGYKGPNVRYNADGTRVLTWTDREARLWDSGSTEALTPVLQHGGVEGARLSANGARIVTWRRGDVRVWDGTDGRLLIPPLRYEEPIKGVRISTDGSRMLIWNERHARIWDSDTGDALTPPLTLPGPIRGARFNADETSLLLWGLGGMKVWDIAVDAQWPVDKKIVKIEVETGVFLTSNGDLQELSLSDWQKRKWCDYDAIQYCLQRITEDEWRTSQRLCGEVSQQGPIKPGLR